MDYFKVKTASDLSKLHDDCYQNCSKATKTTFYQSMRRIERVYDKQLPEIKLAFIDNLEDFLTKLDDSKYSENTKLTTLTNILKLLKMIDAPLMTYNEWLNVLKTKTDSRQKADKVVLQARLKVLMEFEDIKKQVVEASNTYINDKVEFEKYRNFLILSLYTLQIPVRVSNFVNIKVVDDEVCTNDTENFLIVNADGYKFVFNKYRTSHIIGKKEIFVHDETLKFLIDKWISLYNTDSSNLLIISELNKRAMNGRQITDALEKATIDIFGSTLTIDNIRASYMKKIQDLDPDFHDKLDIANILGYSTTEVMDNH